MTKRWMERAIEESDSWLLTSNSRQLDRYLAEHFPPQGYESQDCAGLVNLCYAEQRLWRDYRPAVFRAYVDYVAALPASDMSVWALHVLEPLTWAAMKRHPYDWRRVEENLGSRIAEGTLSEEAVCLSKGLLAQLGHKEYVGVLLEGARSGKIDALVVMRVNKSSFVGIRFPDAATIPGLPTGKEQRKVAIYKAWSEWWRENLHKWHWDPEKRKYAEKSE